MPTKLQRGRRAVAPREYRQKQRAQAAEATRRRIIEAAAAVYGERGVTATTFQAIAERADVSRGTVVNHFGTLDSVLEAVLDRAVDELEYPNASHLDGATTLEERIGRFVDVTYRFFDRSTDWWSVFQRDTELPAVKDRERAYYEVFGEFMAAAFGSLAGDRVVAAAVRAFVDYPVWNALRESGLTVADSVAVVADALVTVAHKRAAASEGG
jgi:AcrR family transcriptional regulator